MRGAPQNGDGRVEADIAIMRLTAQPGHKICILYLPGVQDVDVGRIYTSRGQAKNFNRFESHTQHLSEDETGRLQPDL